MRACDLAAFVTLTLLVLTEQFAQVPAAAVAFAAAHHISARGERTQAP